jgi:hypothetical protein
MIKFDESQKKEIHHIMIASKELLIQQGVRFYPQHRTVPYRTVPFSVAIFITLAVS